MSGDVGGTAVSELGKGEKVPSNEEEIMALEVFHTLVKEIQAGNTTF